MDFRTPNYFVFAEPVDDSLLQLKSIGQFGLVDGCHQLTWFSSRLSVHGQGRALDDKPTQTG